ncbi:hypothetical protein C8A01DRAFT_21038 [Parachaetomium inaequale]|uniref:Uncharacterized protein n=1 Tax=Parachaetomium inaequale TaxID=2588326 RepID=A0AAN6P4W2_9PEZI|nr:hypothetical protein C8A01DRAFT_21038 [Parachaetomium inaequale]
MRFRISSFLTALALTTSASADSMMVDIYCFTLACTYSVYFTTDFGTYSFSGSDGCRSTPVPGMTEFCIDEANDRAHFRFSHQSDKRCMRVYDSEWQTCSDDFQFATCAKEYYQEVQCDW